MSNLERLKKVEKFDLYDAQGKDNVCQMIAIEESKRIRDISDEEVLGYHKRKLIEVFDEECQVEIQGGFISKQNGFKYRTNRDDQINFIGQYLMLKEDDSVKEVFWKTEDAGQQLVSTEVFFNLYKEGLEHKNNTIIKFWKKKEVINSLTNHEELRNMSWDKDYVAPKPFEPEVIETEEVPENEIVLEPEGPGTSVLPEDPTQPEESTVEEQPTEPEEQPTEPEEE